MVKTFRGKNLDMSSVIESNGNVIAAGNSVFNARGDLLGPGGRIIRLVNSLKMNMFVITRMPFASEPKMLWDLTVVWVNIPIR